MVDEKAINNAALESVLDQAVAWPENIEYEGSRFIMLQLIPRVIHLYLAALPASAHSAKRSPADDSWVQTKKAFAKRAGWIDPEKAKQEPALDAGAVERIAAAIHSVAQEGVQEEFTETWDDVCELGKPHYLKMARAALAAMPAAGEVGK